MIMQLHRLIQITAAKAAISLQSQILTQFVQLLVACGQICVIHYHLNLFNLRNLWSFSFMRKLSNLIFLPILLYYSYKQ